MIDRVHVDWVDPLGGDSDGRRAVMGAPAAAEEPRLAAFRR